MKKSYKKYLRQLILENVENVSFKKLQRVNEPDRICSETEEEHVNKVRQKILETFVKASKIIRKEQEHQPKWRFNGTFEHTFSPKLLRYIFFTSLFITQAYK